MRTISVRSDLPPSLWEYRGKMYAYNAQATALFGSNSGHRIAQEVRDASILVPVLHPNLKGRTDLHGRKYAPHYHVFTEGEVYRKAQPQEPLKRQDTASVGMPPKKISSWPNQTPRPTINKTSKKG